VRPSPLRLALPFHPLTLSTFSYKTVPPPLSIAHFRLHCQQWHYRKPRGIIWAARSRAVDKIDFTPGPCRKTLPRYPLSLARTPSLKSRTTFDSAKFETSFHATLPLFHVGRDAYMEEGVYREIRNVLFFHFLPPPLSLSLSSFLPFLYRVLTHPPPAEFDNRGYIDIEFRSRCVWQNFISLSRIRKKNSFIPY